MSRITNTEPLFRSSTKEAQIGIALELDLPPPDDWQDWEYYFAHFEKIERYLEHYEFVNDDDRKFVLMKMLIQATDDKAREGVLDVYWLKLKPLLLKDFKIHEYTIYYWCVFDNENIEDCFAITPLMRAFWKSIRKNWV